MPPEREPPEVLPVERLRLATEHGRMLVAEVGEKVAVLRMRTQIGWYAKGFSFATEVRAAANTIATWRGMETLLRETIDRLHGDDDDREVAAAAAQNPSVQDCA